MQLGLQIPNFTWDGGPAKLAPTLRTIATQADAAGVSSLWVMDHFWQLEMIGPPELDMLEGYTTLGWLAAATERITLGTMVTGVTYRHPGVLIKTVTTLDVLSGGRAWLGIGAAWFEAEHDGLGVPFPPTAERFERLEETLQIAGKMFTADETPFEGTHYTLGRPLNRPAPLSTPRPKILVGGSGEKKTFRFVAQYADACNIFGSDLGTLEQKLGVLRQRCDEAGRDWTEIEKTSYVVLPLGDLGVGGAVDLFAKHAALGVDQAIVSVPGIDRPEILGLLPELVDRLAQITPAGR